jgi:hypothetical protein
MNEMATKKEKTSCLLFILEKFWRNSQTPGKEKEREKK